MTGKLGLAAMVVLAAWSAIAQDVTPLPAPTGPHPTGRASFHWKDEARDELETKDATDRREVMVHLFYPAADRTGGEPARYVPDAEDMRGAWNEAQLERIESLPPNLRENAPPPRGKARYPVAIFMPGGGMKALTYHALLEDLASHGWMVAAVDPPYNARGVRFPDGRVLGNLAPADRGWPQPQNAGESQQFYRERIVHWARDVSFVVDQLAALDRGKSLFAGRLDLGRGVGVFGHSRGGQAAATVRILDKRVRGAINLDGVAGEFAVIPAAASGTEVGAQPFLWIQKMLPPPPSTEQLQRARRTRAEYDDEIRRMMENWQRQLGLIASGALRVTLDRQGIQHIDFSDEPFWDGSMTPENRAGRLRTIAETRAWVRAFFDATIRGERKALKRLVLEKQESVTVHKFGALVP